MKLPKNFDRPADEEEGGAHAEFVEFVTDQLQPQLVAKDRAVETRDRRLRLLFAGSENSFTDQVGHDEERHSKQKEKPLFALFCVSFLIFSARLFAAIFHPKERVRSDGGSLYPA